MTTTELRPGPRHRALIFDCDGTLADSMPVHHAAWTAAFADRGWGGFVGYAEYLTWGGISGEDVVRRAAAASNVDPAGYTTLEVALEKQAHYVRLAPSITRIAPVCDVLETHRGTLPVAVATGSKRASVTQTLTAIGLLGRYDALVSADDVARHKPDPETFLKAAGLLGVAPEHCLAYEDAPPGLAAARAAGMDVVDVSSLTQTVRRD